jgi:hypothetical protein
MFKNYPTAQRTPSKGKEKRSRDGMFKKWWKLSKRSVMSRKEEKGEKANKGAKRN